MPFPFEVGFDEVRSNLDACVDAVFGCLESEFLVMPKGDGFVEFPDFENGYEALKRATGSFREVTPGTVAPVVFETPIALVVLRCMLGFTPSEWAYHTSRHTGVNVTQSAARAIDRSIRMQPDGALSKRGRVTERRIRALAACHALQSGVPEDCERRQGSFRRSSPASDVGSRRTLHSSPGRSRAASVVRISSGTSGAHHRATLSVRAVGAGEGRREGESRGDHRPYRGQGTDDARPHGGNLAPPPASAV